jgi:hypothetical protein
LYSCLFVLRFHCVLQLHGISTATKSAYLKIFRDTIWEAALHGCSSRNKADPFISPQKQQQQQQAPAGLPAAVSYDAVLTIGSPTASQQVLFVLRKAEEAKKARLPVVVHYMVSARRVLQVACCACGCTAVVHQNVGFNQCRGVSCCIIVLVCVTHVLLLLHGLNTCLGTCAAKTY